MDDRFEEMATMLDDIVDALPPEYFRGLNGGVVFSRETMHDENFPELYVLGHYKKMAMGKMIVLYYGSFMELYGNYAPEPLREKLKGTLYHELTHHLEELAGENDLAVEDFEFMERYRRDHG